MKEFKLKSRYDGVNLDVTVFEPEGEAKGILQVVHGMVEHKQRYYQFMEWMARQGYVCIAHDHRGHGKSVESHEGLGYMGKGGWIALVDDVRLVGDWIRNEYPGLPFNLLGHSMGSMVVRSYAKRYDDSIDSLIICGCPSYNPMSGIGIMLAGMISLIRGEHYRSNLLLKSSIGSFRKRFKDGKNAWITSDTNVQESIDKDVLCDFVFTANGYKNLFRLMRDCYSTDKESGKSSWALKKPELPVHFLSGADDPCRVSDKALADAVDKMRQAGYRNVDLKTYRGMRHHIIIEKDKEQVWKDIEKCCIKLS